MRTDATVGVIVETNGLPTDACFVGVGVEVARRIVAMLLVKMLLGAVVAAIVFGVDTPPD